MGTLEFIAALVEALALPAAAVMVLVLFRRSVRALLPNLNRFRYKDLEVEFSKELAAVRAQLEPPSGTQETASRRGRRGHGLLSSSW